MLTHVERQIAWLESRVTELQEVCVFLCRELHSINPGMGKVPGEHLFRDTEDVQVPAKEHRDGSGKGGA